MSDTSGDNIKYKWTPESTALLVSVWSDKQVQKQLEYTPRPQVIWESVARYMRKKGYNVTAKHCRSRMKQLLVCYREAKRAGTRSGVEQHYETIDRVLKDRRLEQINVHGVDTVDATANIKSPPKDVKTNKNLQMRMKVQEPVQSLYRTYALSPTAWTTGRENEYPDSPESNETIIAKPYRVFSPTRDAAINTGQRLIQIGNQTVRTNPVEIEEPIREDYRQNLLITHYPYGEIPYQNTVQNVQNQIIQENMQQYQQNVQQNRGWNQLPQRDGMAINDHGFQQNVRNHAKQHFSNGATQCGTMMQNPNIENIMRQHNQLQQGALHIDNRAMPQEPRKIIFGQNLYTDRAYKQYKDVVPRLACMTDVKRNTGSLSPDYSPEMTQNLNDAFCQSKSDAKTHNLNETYNQHGPFDNPAPNADATVVTNNATCNDDSMLLDFLLDSPTPSDENGGKSRDNAVNTDNAPNAPFRKKKAQKLEQLVLSAINSQNEVVNKILATQNDLVARFLDVDRDRQNRLEDRLDHLLNVVRATVLNKSTEDGEVFSTPPPLTESAINVLLPPPKPGMVPPKLDLVPPKPCRVPCTMASTNVELINQNPVLTRPGIVSPINSPEKRKVGSIWSKLGPVSQSPFVKAQQRLGLQSVFVNNDARTQSSAERRIVKELDGPNKDPRRLIYETAKLLEMERQLEQRIENARLEIMMGQSLTARRRLFTQREPTSIIILTAAFLDAESRACEQDPPYHCTWNTRKEKLKCAQRDNLLAGQGESYERRRLLSRRDYPVCQPSDSSTPAKLPSCNPNSNNAESTYAGVPKQTIQQLARLVMNSARWRDTGVSNQQNNPTCSVAATQSVNLNRPDIEYNATFTAPKANAPPLTSEVQSQRFAKRYDITQRKESNNDEATSDDGLLKNNLRGQSKFPTMGFTTSMLTANDQKGVTVNNDGRSGPLGFADNPPIDRKNNVRFLDEALTELQRMYIERQTAVEGAGEILSFVTMGNGNGAINAHNRNVIERYVSELMMSKKTVRDKDNESDNDDEFLDTTASMHPTYAMSRRGSLTSNGTGSTEIAHNVKFVKTEPSRCRIS